MHGGHTDVQCTCWWNLGGLTRGQFSALSDAQIPSSLFLSRRVCLSLTRFFGLNSSNCRRNRGNGGDNWTSGGVDFVRLRDRHRGRIRGRRASSPTHPLTHSPTHRLIRRQPTSWIDTTVLRPGASPLSFRYAELAAGPTAVEGANNTSQRNAQQTGQRIHIGRVYPHDTTIRHYDTTIRRYDESQQRYRL